MNWDTVELLGYAYYSNRGYRILAPLVHNASYDFVIEKDGCFKSVNVKKAGFANRSQSLRIARAGSKTDKAKKFPDPDLYLVYLPSTLFVELPGTALKGCHHRSISKAEIHRAQPATGVCQQ